MGNQLSESISLQQNDQALQNQTSDEFDLLDLFRFMRRNFIYLLLGMLLGLAIALIFAALSPKQYEATALIKIGEIGSVNTSGTPVEPILQVVDRIKSQSFQEDVLKALKISFDDDDYALVKQFQNNLKVKAEKSELISISLKAASRNEAVKNMQELINQLNKSHNKMSGPTVLRLKQELDSVNNELKTVNVVTSQLTKAIKMQTEQVSDVKFSQSVLFNSLLMSQEDKGRSFRDNKRMLEERLSPERTFNTHVLGRVEVSKKPIYPNYFIFAVVGLLLGLFASLIYIFSRDFKLKLNANQQ